MKLKLLVYAVTGGVLLLAGAAMLVLPGPGLLVILAGLILLSNAFPRLERFIDPVQDRAMKAAEESVSSPWRIAASTLAGCALIGAGIAWGLVSWLPFSGWHTGSSIILSGIVLFVLLIYSYRRVRNRREAEARHG